MSKTACIFGATGLVGGHLLDILANEERYTKIKVVNRRNTDISDAKIEEIIISDFDKLHENVNTLKADDYYCCLGTTIKKAGSKEAFKKVDFEYVINIAALAKENDADSFSVISAMGAKANSMIFYNQIKGEMEDAVKALKNKRTYIFRPSLIEGSRNEERSGEKAAQWIFNKFDFIFKGPLKKYGSVPAFKIAKAMNYIVRENDEEYKVLESDEIKEIG